MATAVHVDGVIALTVDLARRYMSFPPNSDIQGVAITASICSHPDSLVSKTISSRNAVKYLNYRGPFSNTSQQLLVLVCILRQTSSFPSSISVCYSNLLIHIMS